MHETNSSSCMEVWNPKYEGNIYSEFEAKFGLLSEVHFRHTIYRLKLEKLGVQRFKWYANQS